MIILCEKCRTKFRVDEDLLRDDGSRVRCSLCRHIFVAYPSKQIKNPEQKPQTEIDQRPDGLTEALDPETEQAVDFDAGLIEDSMEDIADLEREYEKGQHGLVEEVADIQPAVTEDEIEKKSESDEAAELIAQASGKKGVGKSFTSLIVFLVIIVLIGAGVYVYLYAPHLIPNFLSGQTSPTEVKKSPDLGASRLEIVSVEGSFIDSKRAGRLFAIRGKVTNNYPETRSFILVKGSILDDKGQVIKESSAYAGNTFSDEELMGLPFDRIRKAMDTRKGVNDNNINIQSGQSVDFTIVFEKLPSNLSEFTVGAVSSSPDSPRHEGQDTL